MIQKGEVYINPLTDFGFKRIFGSEMNKDLLISFLNALFNGEREIEDISYSHNEHLGTAADQRRAIFDVYCQTKDGSRIIVEMQNAYQQFFKDRSIYYSTFPITEQAKQGDWNYELKDVYTVGIMNFAFPDDQQTSQLVRVVKLTDVLTKEIFYDKLAYYYVQLVNFNKSLKELNSTFDQWLFALKNMQNLLSRPAELQDRVFSKLFEQAEIAKFTPEERLDYEQSSNAYRDIKNSLDSAENEGFKKGKAEGLAEGLAQGARQQALETVRRMEAMGLSKEQISAATGISIEEIL